MWPRRIAILASVCVCLAACATPARHAQRPPSKAEEAAALQVELGQQYLSKGDLEAAQDKLRRAIELDPKSADAYVLLAILNERIRRPEIAEKHYRKAADLKPEDGAINNNYGTFLCAQGRYEEADRHFLIAINDPFYKTPAVAYTNAGVCTRKAGAVERAELHFRRALELDPNNVLALYEMAAVSYARHDYLRARAFIQRFEARAPADASLLLLAIEVEAQLGDGKAEAGYRARLQQEFPDVEIPAERTDESP